jgi:hypothetical protein
MKIKLLADVIAILKIVAIAGCMRNVSQVSPAGDFLTVRVDQVSQLERLDMEIRVTHLATAKRLAQIEDEIQAQRETIRQRQQEMDHGSVEDHEAYEYEIAMRKQWIRDEEQEKDNAIAYQAKKIDGLEESKASVLTEADLKIGYCEIHRVALEQRDIPITYGYPAPKPEGYQEARRAQFRNSGMPVFGGCVVSASSPKTIRLAVCPVCVRARRLWLEKHKIQGR